MGLSLNIPSILWTVEVTEISWPVHNGLSPLSDLAELAALVMGLPTACGHPILQSELLDLLGLPRTACSGLSIAS